MQKMNQSLTLLLIGTLILCSPIVMAEGKVPWGYEGETGPTAWGDLSQDYLTCKTGHQQSPIDIRGGGENVSIDLKFDYRTVSLDLVNNGHTIQANYPAGSVLRTKQKTYRLLQLHFHSPSEHMINGQRAPMEMHLVHQGNQGELRVVGVMIKQGRVNLALDKIWRNMPKQANERYQNQRNWFNARDLLPFDQFSFFRYTGSLTTPPCSEGVQWHVMEQPIEASAGQINQFLSVIGQNARPVQPSNNRLLIRSGY